MTHIESIILGVVQGITEFLPVSSTGHLVLLRDILKIETEQGLAIDATLHFATALAVLLYFRKDIIGLFFALFKKSEWSLRGDTKSPIRILAIIFGTIPAVIGGLLLEDYMETTFRSKELVAVILLFGSLLFILGEIIYKRIVVHTTVVSARDGFLIGLFQVLALFPGMSRSGSTIAGGMILGLSRETAARFTFILSLPIILGAGSKKIIELLSETTTTIDWVSIGTACLSAFIAGILSIHLLLAFLRKYTLYPFVVYRVILAGVILFSPFLIANSNTLETAAEKNELLYSYTLPEYGYSFLYPSSYTVTEENTILDTSETVFYLEPEKSTIVALGVQSRDDSSRRENSIIVRHDFTSESIDTYSKNNNPENGWGEKDTSTLTIDTVPGKLYRYEKENRVRLVLYFSHEGYIQTWSREFEDGDSKTEEEFLSIVESIHLLDPESVEDLPEVPLDTPF